MREERPRVLIIEDEAIVALDLQHQLEAAGFHVVGTVGRADEVVSRVQETRPDVVLMDVRLRGNTDGVTLAEEVFVCDDIPIVFLSAFSDRDIIQRAAISGAYGYLTKPVSSAALTSTLEMAIHKHRELRSHRADSGWFVSWLDAFEHAVVGLDATGSVRFMNRGAVQLTGWLLPDARARRPRWIEQLLGIPDPASPTTRHVLELQTRSGEPVRVGCRKWIAPGVGGVYVIWREAG